MPEGDVAICHYTGPYDRIAEAYDALSRWVQKQGRQPTGVVYEVYLSDPGDTASESLQTQILFPLKEGRE
jgi:effector-binding domain-containing protein